jgi:hypothetical protein
MISFLGNYMNAFMDVFMEIVAFIMVSTMD